MGTCLAASVRPRFRGVPADAVALPADEAKQIFDAMKGDWLIAGTAAPLYISSLPEASMHRRRRRLGAQRVQYTNVSVHGDSYTLYGGRMPKQTNKMVLRRGTWHDHPTGPKPGAIFLDHYGSVITAFVPKAGILEFSSGLYIDICWRRPGIMEADIPKLLAASGVTGTARTGTSAIPEAMVAARLPGVAENVTTTTSAGGGGAGGGAGAASITIPAAVAVSAAATDGKPVVPTAPPAPGGSSSSDEYAGFML